MTAIRFDTPLRYWCMECSVLVADFITHGEQVHGGNRHTTIVATAPDWPGVSRVIYAPLRLWDAVLGGKR
jgi:hypothetical protein